MTKRCLLINFKHHFYGIPSNRKLLNFQVPFLEFRLQGSCSLRLADKDGPEHVFLHKWTGQKIMDGPDWTSQTKIKKDKSGPLIFLARPYMHPCNRKQRRKYSFLVDRSPCTPNFVFPTIFSNNIFRPHFRFQIQFQTCSLCRISIRWKIRSKFTKYFRLRPSCFRFPVSISKMFLRMAWLFILTILPLFSRVRIEPP